MVSKNKPQKRALKASLAIFNGNIITMNPHQSRAHALAVYGGNIIAIGTNRDIKSYVDGDTKIIDAKEKTVTPGFIDAHMHPKAVFLDAKHRLHVVNLADASTIDDLIYMLKAKAELTPRGEWIRGTLYDDVKLGKHPTREDLDRVSTNHLIHINHTSLGHCCVVNSPVLAISGMTRDSQDPPNGILLRFLGHSNYSDGTPNGILQEAAGAYVLNATGKPFPLPTEKEEKEGLQKLFKNLLSMGVTSIGDARVEGPQLSRYHEMLKENMLPIRINMMIFYTKENWEAIKKLWGRGNFGNDRLRIGCLKLLAGNSFSGRTCWLSEPYLGRYKHDDPPYYGIPQPMLISGEIDGIVFEGHKAGFQWAIHVNGDREINRVLDAYEVALQQHPVKDHRHRIEHGSIMGKDLQLLKRAKKLGVVLVFHSYTYEHGNKYSDYGEDRITYMHAYRSAVDLGIPVAGHSDWPLVSSDPLMRIQDMVTRKSKEGIVYGPQQRVTPEEAIRIWSLGGAYASFEDHIKGSLEVGKLADLVILSADPTEVDHDKIKDIAVEKTIVGGEVVFEQL